MSLRSQWTADCVWRDTQHLPPGNLYYNSPVTRKHKKHRTYTVVSQSISDMSLRTQWTADCVWRLG
ncbi:hypothetical protein J6590_046426 [Homalodisca vitripennis]|nr:hypothetical protein J6590_046426 [Homalodisca vitripennis]